MSISMDWRWWTYFVADGHLVTCGRILDYDVDKKWLHYIIDHPDKATTPPPVDETANEPYDIFSDEYKAWLYAEREGTYDHLWVDPTKGSGGWTREEIDAMPSGAKPEKLIVLPEGLDPKDYFKGEKVWLSRYGPPELWED